MAQTFGANTKLTGRNARNMDTAWASMRSKRCCRPYRMLAWILIFQLTPETRNWCGLNPKKALDYPHLAARSSDGDEIYTRWMNGIIAVAIKCIKLTVIDRSCAGRPKFVTDRRDAGFDDLPVRHGRPALQSLSKAINSSRRRHRAAMIAASMSSACENAAGAQSPRRGKAEARSCAATRGDEAPPFRYKSLLSNRRLEGPSSKPSNSGHVRP